MKYILAFCLIISNSFANDKGPKAFVKSEIEKMLNGEDISLLKSTDYFPTTYLTENYDIKKVESVKNNMGYYRALISFKILKVVEKDPLYEKQNNVKPKVINKSMNLELIFYFKKEKSGYKWTSKLEQVFLNKKAFYQ
jgi:hypothetical protein